VRKWIVDRLIPGFAVANFRSYSRVAQVVEQVTVNHRVGGSSPSSGAVYFDLLVKEKTGTFREGGARFVLPPSNPALYTDDGRRRAIVNRYCWIGGLALIALIVVWNVFT
jgi:hypothetical protein